MLAIDNFSVLRNLPTIFSIAGRPKLSQIATIIDSMSNRIAEVHVNRGGSTHY